MQPSIVDVLLIIQAVWDFGCAWSILLHIPPLWHVHISFWKDESNVSNEVARRLLAYLILVWGALRLEGATVGGVPYGPTASFVLEGVVFGCETFVFRTVWLGKGACVTIVCFVMAMCLLVLGDT